MRQFVLESLGIHFRPVPETEVLIGGKQAKMAGKEEKAELMFRTAGLRPGWIMSPLVIMYRNRKAEMSVPCLCRFQHEARREEKGGKNKKAPLKLAVGPQSPCFITAPISFVGHVSPSRSGHLSY